MNIAILYQHGPYMFVIMFTMRHDGFIREKIKMNIAETIIVTRLRAAGCVFAEDETRLLVSAARSPDDLSAMVDSRIAGLPLEHVIGWAEFCGLRIAVDPGVFVPRHRTEFLVRQASALAQSGAVVVDLCCGSGAVGTALAAVLERIELYATVVIGTKPALSANVSGPCLAGRLVVDVESRKRK
jgi:hypothetical protein